MLARRNFLRGAVAAPFAAKQAAETAVASLSRVQTGGLTGSMFGEQKTCVPGPIGPIGPSADIWAKVIGNTALRKELESIYFERERGVSSIDPDIAAYRSFSLNAKIAFQRQRNVQRQIDGLISNQGWWERFSEFGQRVMGIKW